MRKPNKQPSTGVMPKAQAKANVSARKPARKTTTEGQKRMLEIQMATTEKNRNMIFSIMEDTDQAMEVLKEQREERRRELLLDDGVDRSHYHRLEERDESLIKEYEKMRSNTDKLDAIYQRLKAHISSRLNPVSPSSNEGAASRVASEEGRGTN